MRCGRASEVERIVLTASGGPFRERDLATFDAITVEDALAHPTWKMGPKITIDSATMMNKGLEIIEAHFLFGACLPIGSRSSSIRNPSSIPSSSSRTARSSRSSRKNDMKFPIVYALDYPRPRCATDFGRLDLVSARRSSSSSRSSPSGIRRSSSPGTRSGRGAECPPSSTRRTKSPSPRSCRGRFPFPTSFPWSRRRRRRRHGSCAVDSRGGGGDRSHGAAPGLGRHSPRFPDRRRELQSPAPIARTREPLDRSCGQHPRPDRSSSPFSSSSTSSGTSPSRSPSASRSRSSPSDSESASSGGSGTGPTTASRRSRSAGTSGSSAWGRTSRRSPRARRPRRRRGRKALAARA